MKKIIFSILLMCMAFQNYAIDALLISTIDYSFKEKWNNTVGSSIPTVTVCDTVFRKQYFFITVVVMDYALDSKSSADVLYSIKITKPDQTIYFSQENLTLIKGKVADKNNLQMSDAVIKVSFEDKDPFGKYKIETGIIDKVSGKSKSISREINLVPLPPYDHIQVKNDDDFSEWISGYYKNPKPEDALAHYIYYSQSKLSDKESGFWPVFSIFLEIVKNNAYLLPQITDCYKSQDLKRKIYLLYLLTYSNIGAEDFFKNLEGDENEAYQKIKASPLPDIYGTISRPSQLDMLWGTFTASGSYKPILKLIQTLDYVKYKGYLDKFKESKKTEDDKQKALNNSIYDALVWSLKSNCQQHKLVKEYCNWAVNYENLSNVQRDELAAVLKDKK